LKTNTLKSHYEYSIILFICLFAAVSLIVYPPISYYCILFILLFVSNYFYPEVGFVLFITDGMILSCYYFILDLKSLSILITMLILLLMSIYLKIHRQDQEYISNKGMDKKLLYLSIIIGLVLSRSTFLIKEWTRSCCICL